MKPKNSKPRSSWFRLLTGTALVATLLSLLPASASAAIIIHDNFGSWNSNGQPTTALPTTDNTGLTNNYWSFRDSAYYESSLDRIISSATGQHAGGAIRTGTTLSSLTAGTMEVTGQFVINNLSISEQTAPVPVQWVAVGFLSGTGNDVFSSDSRLWALVHPNGQWTLFANGTSITLATSNAGTQLPSFAGSTNASPIYTNVTLKYDLDGKSAALFVDDANISGWISYDLELTSITGAGFKIWATTGAAGSQPRTATLNEFTVSSAIPEPAGAATLAGVAALVLLGVMRRGRREL